MFLRGSVSRDSGIDKKLKSIHELRDTVESFASAADGVKNLAF